MTVAQVYDGSKIIQRNTRSERMDPKFFHHYRPGYLVNTKIMNTVKMCYQHPNQILYTKRLQFQRNVVQSYAEKKIVHKHIRPEKFLVKDPDSRDRYCNRGPDYNSEVEDDMTDLDEFLVHFNKKYAHQFKSVEQEEEEKEEVKPPSPKKIKLDDSDSEDDSLENCPNYAVGKELATEVLKFAQLPSTHKSLLQVMANKVKSRRHKAVIGRTRTLSNNQDLMGMANPTFVKDNTPREDFLRDLDEIVKEKVYDVYKATKREDKVRTEWFNKEFERDYIYYCLMPELVIYFVKEKHNLTYPQAEKKFVGRIMENTLLRYKR